MLVLVSSAIVAQKTNADWKKLHYLSEKEMYLPLNAANFYETPPPVGPIRNVAEFDQMEAVVVRYPFGIPLTLVKEIAKDLEVLTLVANENEQQTVISQYTNAGVNLENCSFLHARTDSYWVRDYGPWFVFDGNEKPGIVNFPYNRPRPNDNDIPIEIAEYLDIDLYGMNLIQTGGNYMTEGMGISSSTELVVEENPNLNSGDIDSIVFQYLNIENYYIVDDPLDEYIKHIDCWGKFLSPGKVLIGEVPETDNRYADYEAVANFYKSTISSWGKPFEVFRVFTPGTKPYTPYTNSLIANKKVFVPLTGSEWDDEAIESYELAMPGYEIVGINYGGWLNTDALHCRAKGIADIGMLYISHIPVLGNVSANEDVEIVVDVNAYSGAEVYEDSVLLYYSINEEAFTSTPLTWTSDDTYTGTISGLKSGDDVSYYIYAADESGRKAMHPYIGQPDPHEFSVTGFQTDEIDLDPDTLLFSTFDEMWTGLELRIINLQNDSVEITEITTEYSETSDFPWYIEKAPEVPFMLAGSDTINLLVQVYIAVKNTGEILEDTLFVHTPKDKYHMIISLDSDLLDVQDVRIASDVKVFPNPFNEQLNIGFSLGEEKQLRLTIFSLSGKVIFKKDYTFSSGDHTIRWKAPNDLKAGTYFYRLEIGEETRSGKVILRD